MTDAERKRLRELQDRWLSLPVIRQQIERCGEDACIVKSPNAPTFREVREMLLPSWEVWFQDFFAAR